MHTEEKRASSLLWILAYSRNWKRWAWRSYTLTDGNGFSETRMYIQYSLQSLAIRFSTALSIKKKVAAFTSSWVEPNRNRMSSQRLTTPKVDNLEVKHNCCLISNHYSPAAADILLQSQNSSADKPLRSSAATTVQSLYENQVLPQLHQVVGCGVFCGGGEGAGLANRETITFWSWTLNEHYSEIKSREKMTLQIHLLPVLMIHGTSVNKRRHLELGKTLLFLSHVEFGASNSDGNTLAELRLLRKWFITPHWSILWSCRNTGTPNIWYLSFSDFRKAFLTSSLFS